MQQWEYNKYQWIYQGKEQEIKMLDSFGKIGWEHYFIDGNMYYFKRPIPQPSTVDKIFNKVKDEVEVGHMEVKTTS